MYETKTVLRTWYEMGWYEGWEVYGYTEFDSAGFPRMAEIRRPTPLALDGGDSAAFQALSTPEVLSTLQGESTPAHRK